MTTDELWTIKIDGYAALLSTFCLFKDRWLNRAISLNTRRQRFIMPVNKSPQSFVACAIILFLLTGCEDRKPSPIPSDPSNTSLKNSSVITDQLLGKWIGPEGTFLQITGGAGKYEITIQNLDGPRIFQGRKEGNEIEFERDDVKYSLHASTGIDTGMKWLSEKYNCVTVAAGEGYCRD